MKGWQWVQLDVQDLVQVHQSRDKEKHGESNRCSLVRGIEPQTAFRCEVIVSQPLMVTNGCPVKVPWLMVLVRSRLLSWTRWKKFSRGREDNLDNFKILTR